MQTKGRRRATFAAPAGASAARRTGGLDSNFNFPLAKAVLEGVAGGAAEGIAAKLREMAELYPQGGGSPPVQNSDPPPT